MKIHGNQLNQHLRGELPPIIWISGDETLLAQEAADTCRACCREQGFSEREVWHADSSIDWEAILGSANSLSLFAERKLIELRFPSAKPGDKALKALLSYLENPNPDTVILASGPKLDTSVPRTKTFKQLENTMLFVQIWPVDNDRLGNWLAERMRAKGLSANREAIQLLADRTEGNLLAAQQEIDKLALLAEGEVGPEDVLRVVADSARYNVFDLSERILQGDSKAVKRTLEGLRAEGTDAISVLWAVTRDVRRLISLRQATDNGRKMDSVFQQERIFNRQQGPYRKAAQRLSLAQLTPCLEQCRSIDSAIKGMGNDDPWRGLMDLGMKLAGTPVMRA